MTTSRAFARFYASTTGFLWGGAGFVLLGTLAFAQYAHGKNGKQETTATNLSKSSPQR